MLSDLLHRKYVHYFNLWDLDHNGQLAFEDYLLLTNRIAHEKGYAKDSAEYQKMYDYTATLWEGIQVYADQDDDGIVLLDDWVEYCAAAVEQLRKDEFTLHAVAEQFASFFFSIIDQDGDGVVNATDWAGFVSAWGIKQNANENFKNLDVDGDGQLSLSDMLALYKQFILSEDPQEPGNYMFGPLN